jgi:hypothetical protein
MSEGKFDFAKGSFYANPLHDRPVDDEVYLFDFRCISQSNLVLGNNQAISSFLRAKHLAKGITFKSFSVFTNFRRIFRIWNTPSKRQGNW